MNRTLLVTGATSGIGRAICMGQLSEGRRVIGIGRDFSKVLPDDPNFVPLTMDLGDLKRLPDHLKALTKDYPEVDALVLCAGRGLFGDLEQYSYPQMRELMDLNFLSPVYLTRAFLPSMKRRGYGDVILMGSEAGLAGKSHGSIYCASKAALRSFAQSLRAEVASSGVRVTIINAGMVNTPFFDKLGFTPGPDAANAIEARDVADTVSMILKLRAGTVADEINLTPLKHVVAARKSPQG